MKSIYTTLFFAFLVINLAAQIDLKPSIGIGTLPADTESVCEIPDYLGSFEASGLHVGDTIADFNLYDLNGNNYEISEILEAGKPVLLVSSSYTCPVFRGKVPLINQIASDYEGELSVFIIYTVEAHPSGDISPYFGFENVGNQNIQAGILYNQPTNYGERKAVVSDMLSEMNIEVPVLIDGPCNEWWAHFGPAPNNSYLIDTDGVIFSKHGWFNKYPADILCDLEQYFGSGEDCEIDVTGSFQFQLLGDSTTSGEVGQTIYVYGSLINPSNNPVEIEVKRMIENVPLDWSTSMCIDVCYGTDVDYTTILLEPGEMKPYTMYFYTGSNAAEGMVRMGFRNLNNQQNRYIQNMYASTSLTAVSKLLEPEVQLEIFPNPTNDLALVKFSGKINGTKGLKIYDATGQIVNAIQFEIKGNVELEVDFSNQPGGVYFIQVEIVNQKITKRLVVIK